MNKCLCLTHVLKILEQSLTLHTLLLLIMAIKQLLPPGAKLGPFRPGYSLTFTAVLGGQYY